MLLFFLHILSGGVGHTSLHENVFLYVLTFSNVNVL